MRVSVCREKGCGSWLTAAGAVVLVATGSPLTQLAWAHNGGGGGGGGESGTATHQHLDWRFSHNRYYYDRGYAVHRPPAGGVANLTGSHGERYYFQGGNWFRWRGDWYRLWGGAWVVVDAPVGMFVPALPPHYTTIWWSGAPYYYANDSFYVWDAQRKEFEVVAPPERFRAASATPKSRHNERKNSISAS
jgi:hypothetical protein